MKADFYINNREKLYMELPEASIFVICSGGSVYRTADDTFRFFANRSFVYLTGISEPDCILMAWRTNSEINEVLFVRDKDPAAEVRGGRRKTKEEAAKTSGIGRAAYMSEFGGLFHDTSNDIHCRKLFLCLESNTGQEAVDQNHSFKRMAEEKYPGLEICNIFFEISKLRSIKSHDEIENLKKALDTTREGIIKMMQSAKTAETEMDLFAEFMYVINKHGEVEPAFKPIISCGSNNFYLHYDTPAGKLLDGELCLSDVGAICDFCCVDISRVFPRNGRFTQRQKDVYNTALEANDEITAEIKTGMQFSEIDNLYRKKVFPRLKALGLLEGEDELDKYIWHRLSHYIGFDVHDVGSYQVPIQKNMVFTMDTGIYIRQWGIGMRIEDNVLATDNGLLCLSKEIPRTIHEIENVMN